MTTQNAGPDGSLDADEAERLASMIKPAWELDGGDDDAPPAAVVAEAAASEAARPSGAEAPAHDTLVDGVPTVAIGTTDPGVSPAGEAVVPEREAPKAAGPTRVGVGEPSEDASTGAEKSPRRPRGTDREVTEAVGRPLVAAEDVPPSSRKKPARTPVAPQGASFSKIEDPIEIPVENKSRGMLFVGGAVALVAVVAIGWFATRSDSGGSTAPTATATTKPATTAAAKPVPTEPATPTATATAAPAPEPTTTATAAAATAEPTAEPVATAPAKTSEPVAAAPKPTSKPTSGGTKPPSGGTKPPSGGGKGSGGIMRDAPF